MKTVEVFHPQQSSDVTKANADAVTTAAALLAAPSVDSITDVAFRKLLNSLSQECGLRRGHLQQLSTRVRLKGMTPGDALTIDYGRGIVGRYPAKEPNQGLRASLDAMLIAMTAATNRAAETTPA